MFIKKVGIVFVVLIAFLLALSALIRYLVLDPVAGNEIIIEQGMSLYDLHYKPWNYALYIHIITAAIALIVGPFQFMKSLRNKRLDLHRIMGKIYVATIFISSIVGIYLSYYAFVGWISKLGFFTLSLTWLITTYVAFHHIRNKRLSQHENWMYRSYAVTFVAVTFRFWSAALGYSLDNFQVGYTAAVWVSLLSNLLVMEYWLRKRSSVVASRIEPFKMSK